MRSGDRASLRRSSTTCSRWPVSASSASAIRGSPSTRGGERFEAILFNHVEALPATIRAAYRPEVNEWNGSAAIQLVVEHWSAVA